MAKKKMPINFKQVMDAASGFASDRNKPVNIGIFVDTTASQRMVDIIRAAFDPQSASANVNVESYGDSVPNMFPSDCVLLVAGDSPATGTIAKVATSTQTPLAVVTDDLPDLVRCSEEMLCPLPDSCIVALDPKRKDAESSFLDMLGDLLVDICKPQRLALAAAFPFMKRPLSLEIIRTTSLENAAIGGVSILPGSDLPLMTLNQAKMILQLAGANGEEIDFARAKEIAAAIAGGFACRAVARQVSSAVPVIGWAVKAGIGYSGTYAMGRAVMALYEGGGSCCPFLARRAEEQGPQQIAVPVSGENAQDGGDGTVCRS